MVTCPSATPVTLPVASTVALELSDDDHVTVLAALPVAVTVAVSWSVPFTATFLSPVIATPVTASSVETLPETAPPQRSHLPFLSPST